MTDTLYVAVVLTIAHLVFGYIHLETHSTEIPTPACREGE